jgi:hypothetical protein
MDFIDFSLFLFSFLKKRMLKSQTLTIAKSERDFKKMSN